jgi:hypothetical protein
VCCGSFHSEKIIEGYLRKHRLRQSDGHASADQAVAVLREPITFELSRYVEHWDASLQGLFELSLNETPVANRSGYPDFGPNQRTSKLPSGAPNLFQKSRGIR